MCSNVNSYPCSIEFFLYKVRKAWREFEQNQKTLQEYQQKYKCENSPFAQHDFQPYQPFVGCYKHVCRFCGRENRRQNFKQSVYAHKGKRFGSAKKPASRKKKTE